ncbi:NIPSNAP family protein [Rhodovulum sp. DZ06]|uniref:NIPSNAP family protein n=1 Tax=Rhodovulum sp. DZ06 TaxID=3425126 RepID=UPI003D32CCE0
MPLYEQRVYQVRTGEMPTAIKLYQDEGWPAFEAAGLADHCMGYFITDTGALHRLVHIWKFEDDVERRAFWEKIYAFPAFIGFAKQIRPLLNSQEVTLMKNAPFGPVL